MIQVKLPKALITALLLTMAASFSAVADAAEKREQTFVKSNFRTLYKTVLAVGDASGHEVIQEANIADITSLKPGLSGSKRNGALRSAV